MKLTKTEEKIFFRIYFLGGSGFVTEETLRKYTVKRKSPVYKELNSLIKKGLIRIEKPEYSGLKVNRYLPTREGIVYGDKKYDEHVWEKTYGVTEPIRVELYPKDKKFYLK